ncbi:DUF3830 family protein [Oceanobacillus halotolerans]|uniref:DUF3830 family protein n=1 Tax=Oceanobacillus halotolerans TaxID=2663380 RepID=UPI0013DC7965|nr:DUF3830 family protein [Oceanobacillus halotolerans]
MKRIRIRFEGGEELYATLIENSAPQTCKIIWESLPFQSVVTQSRWSGREVNLKYDNNDYPIRENQTIYTGKGELCYWRDWNSEGDIPPSQAIAIYYGAELARSNRGNEPVNVFAQIDFKYFNILDEIGERIWLKGAEDIYFERLD